MKKNFCSCKENFIRSGYYKVLLNQGDMLFVININFYVPVCLNYYQISELNCRFKRLVVTHQRMTLLAKLC